MSLVFLLAEATAALIALAAMVAIFYRSQSAALFAVLGVFFADSIFIGIPPLEFGGFNLYPQDLISTVLLATALIRLALRRPTTLHLAWALFALTGVLSFYTGFQLYGAKSSGVEFRQPLFLIANVFYFSSFTFSETSFGRIKRAWYIVTAGLVALAIYRWLAEWFGLPGMESWEMLRTTSPGRITRTLMAGQALFLFQAWLLTGPSLMGRRKRIIQLASVVLLGFVFMLQHRTVWVATLVCLVYLFGRIRMLLHRPLWLATSAATVCGLFLFFSFADSSNGIAASLRYSLSEPTSDRSTLEWRVSSWRQLLGDDNGRTSARDTLLGYLPYGAGLRRRVDGSVVNVSAHNFYIDTLMRTGAVGLSVLLLCYGLIIFRIRRTKSEDSSQKREWGVILSSLLISQLAYSFGYSAGYEQGVLIGAALSLAAARATGVARAHGRISMIEHRVRRSTPPFRAGNAIAERGI